MHRRNGKRVWYRSAAPCRGMRTSVGWVGWGAKVTSPTQTALRSSSHRGFASHVRLSASTHSRISQPQHTPPTELGGSARRRAALTPVPGPSAISLSVGRSVPCLACVRALPVPRRCGRCEIRRAPLRLRESFGAHRHSLRGLGAALRPHHRQPSHMFGPHPNRPRAVGFAPQMASHAGILTDPQMLQT